MKKSLKILKEIAAGVFILILLLKFSDYLHNATSSHIITVLYNNAGFVGIIICIFEFLISCYNAIDAKLKEKMKLKYHMVARWLQEIYESRLKEVFSTSLISCPVQLWGSCWLCFIMTKRL